MTKQKLAAFAATACALAECYTPALNLRDDSGNRPGEVHKRDRRKFRKPRRH